ncbi:MAG: PPC domain-containing DNA-binding protein [Candidatus Helarchaeota archaeon]
MKAREIGIGRMFFIKLEPSDDILEAITMFAENNSIKSGFFTAIGAIKHAKIGYYQLNLKEYKTISLEGDFELVSCIGNITQKEGFPLIHAHIVIADVNGHTYGGHLLPGCRISVTGEVFLIEAKNTLIREIEDMFKLSLIKIK